MNTIFKLLSRTLFFASMWNICSASLSAADRNTHSPVVVLISIDGLKPEAILAAGEHGLRVPNLLQMKRDGIYATGVRGVLPTLTYPSHTTLLTGVSPAKHGIYANTTFDPLNRNYQGWYWYAEDIRVPTLWDAAHAAGLTTANIYWPVSVGAQIDYNLPQIWRAGTADDLKLQRSVATKGLEPELVADLGRYPGGMEETVGDDEVRARFAIRLLETKHPQFITIYLTGLDTEQHKSGPFSDKANAVLERLDAVVGQIRLAAEKAAPDRTYLCVVSDHGFAPVQHDVNLYYAFHDAGLFELDKDNKIASWKSIPWPAGGSAAVMLKDPADASTRTQTAALLARLAADGSAGVDRVLDKAALSQQGGFPNADFFVAFKPGYELGFAFAAPLISPPGNLGMHGYLPDQPEMRSALFLIGPDVKHAVSLGEIDMRSIAATLAPILGVHLPAAELPPLPWR